MNQRIQKIIADSGVTSRRKAEELINGGRVTCNGEVCLLGQSADPDVDTILLDGKPLPSGGGYAYIMLHKPRGYVTTLSDEKGRKTVAQLVADCGTRVYPVGRLDMDSEGLLILTNDGEFANKLMHPSHQVDKTYRVTVTGYTPDALERLSRPITLDGYTIAKPTVELLSANEKGSAQLRVVIHEGRNRQVRRMCAAAGMQVSRLVRVAEGKLPLGRLPLGKWRHLTPEERKLLLK
jgi:23S rRNA pseudouridine2605 synthase